MATAVLLSKEHISKTPGVCGGKACIAGSRIRVMDVVVRHDAGQSPEAIAATFPSITLADVYAALTYYYDHRDEIAAEFEREDELAKFGETQPSLLREAIRRHPELWKQAGD